MPSDIGNFDNDRWQLFHVDADRSEAVDLASKHPDKLKELQDLWMAEAKRNNVLPLNDLTLPKLFTMAYESEAPASGRYVYYPNTTEVPERSAANTFHRSYKILAEVEFTGDSQGVIFAQGSRFGGYVMFVKEGRLFYVYNFLGIPPEQRLVCAAPSLGKHVVGVEFTKGDTGGPSESRGTMKLYVDDTVAAEGAFRTHPLMFSLCGEGLCIARDSGDAVSSEYKPNFPFSGGRVIKVIFDLADDVYLDVERKLAAAMARD
jgi:arylsulfatase